jgi:hypothetical protein
MNLGLIFLSLLMCASNIALSGNLTKESLEQKSLQELHVLYDTKMLELQPEPAFKKLQKQKARLGNLYTERAGFACNCAYSQTLLISWIKGSPEDCVKMQQMDERISRQHVRIMYANKKLSETNSETSSDLTLLSECILAKEYEEIELD